MSTRTVLHEADIARALTRISHEILESNKGPEGLVLLGIPTRGVTLAHRIAALIAEFGGTPVPGRRARRHDVPRRPAPQPDPRAAADRDPAGRHRRQDRRARRRRAVLGRSIRAALDALQDIGRPRRCGSRRWSTAATASCRSAPTSWARTCRAPATSASTCGWPRSTAIDEVTIEIMRHLLDTKTLARDDALAHPRRRRGHGRHPAARGQEAPDPARQDGRQPLLRGLHPHAHLVRGRREAPERRRHQLLGEGLERLEGRVACRTPRRPCRRWGRMPSSSATARPARRARSRRAAGSPPASSTPATARTSTRRRRCSTPSRSASAASATTAAAATSTGSRVTIVGDILHSRVARSNVWLLDTLGAEVTLVAPPTLVPQDVSAWPVRVLLRPRRGDRRRAATRS